MRYAIVSDIHANIRAWDSVLADLRTQGADVVICLGDVVGYGPKPAEVLAAVRSVTSHFVMGNHDAAAVGMIDYSIFNSHARQAIEWTMTALDSEAKEFLASVPLSIEADDILFVHAEISEPGRFDYISDSKIAKANLKDNKHLVTFIGHTHYPKIFEQNKRGMVSELPDKDTILAPNKRYIVNVGSVGEPRNKNDLRARYVIYDTETRNVIFRKVQFDILAYREDLYSTTLSLSPFFLRVYEHISEGREVTVSSGGTLVDMEVSHNSASLVDLGKVTGVTDLSKSETLKSAQPSRASVTILIIGSILTLVIVGFWLVSSLLDSSSTLTKASPELDTNRVQQGTKEDTPDTVARVDKVDTPHTQKLTDQKAKAIRAAQIYKEFIAREAAKAKELMDRAIAKAKAIARAKAKATANGQGEVKKPIINTAKTTTTIWWRMGDSNDGQGLIDINKQTLLKTIKKGRNINALAPNPIPRDQLENKAAKQLGVWQEEHPQNHFALSTNKSFTFEGWFLIGSFRKPVFIMGTRLKDSISQGWHLDFRPTNRNKRGESIGFYYNSGETITQAIAKDLKLNDGASHHFAIVWDHDQEPDQGVMKVYLDGEEVASTRLPHNKIIGEQIHPLSIGSKLNLNRIKIGLDELRFTSESLEPKDFLLKRPIVGITLMKSDGRLSDSWSIAENWDGGKIPTGPSNVIISSGLKVQIKNIRPLPFSGSLILKEKAILNLYSKDSESIIPREKGKLVMYKDSQLVIKSHRTHTKLGPIELAETASILGGLSNRGHHSKRSFESIISGPGQLKLIGVNNNAFTFKVENTFSGGLIVKSQSNQDFRIVAKANGCLGLGDVVIEDHASLQIKKGLNSTISDDANFSIKGVKGRLETKLVLDSNETVGKFIIDGVDQGIGTFSKTTHPKIISGDGKIIVK